MDVIESEEMEEWNKYVVFEKLGESELVVEYEVF